MVTLSIEYNSGKFCLKCVPRMNTLPGPSMRCRLPCTVSNSGSDISFLLLS
uniref:Uncharacterized protein n=1 Tax=Anguilla anguilla TaxID=7936 RepID=A0A0E9XQX5_ANGAN